MEASKNLLIKIPEIINGIANPNEYTNKSVIPERMLVSVLAKTKIDPKIGPMQGVQPNPKQTPVINENNNPLWIRGFWNLASKFKKDKLIIPISCNEKIIIIIAAILVISFEFENKKWPIVVAVAPNEIKTTEKPKVKKIVLNKTFFWKFELISWIVWPEINEIYPGINGRTHGDKKLTIPEKKATKSDTLILLVFFL